MMKLPKQWKHWCVSAKLKPHNTRPYRNHGGYIWFYLKGRGYHWRVNDRSEFECGDTYEKFDRWALCDIIHCDVPKTKKDFIEKVDELLRIKYHPAVLSRKHFRNTNKTTPKIIAAAVADGMIPKNQLIDGEIYSGHCRNASYATWHADKNKFTYIRNKFNTTFPEDICHPEDDNGFDLFVPTGIHHEI